MAASSSATTVWEGGLAHGSGVTTPASGAFPTVDVTWASRTVRSAGKTSPEELLAAAHATCFVTSLGSELARAGTPPERMHVHCTVTMDEVEGRGHLIVASSISAHVVAPGVDDAGLAKAAADADAGCPFSALIRASATVTVDATLEGGT
jgi:osmotically inducible protein OsmC